jgi:hypothetical protein
MEMKTFFKAFPGKRIIINGRWLAAVVILQDQMDAPVMTYYLYVRVQPGHLQKGLKETERSTTGGFCPAGGPVRAYTIGLNVHSVT